MCANSEGSGENARMRNGHLCDKYHKLTSWLISKAIMQEAEAVLPFVSLSILAALKATNFGYIITCSNLYRWL